MYKVSYLIALYNKEKHVLSALESVLRSQSTAYDVEVCVVDDGSTDGSLQKVLDKYSNDPRVKVASFSKNRGKNAAYNKAFGMSSGSLISLMGADDEATPQRTVLLGDLCLRTGKAVCGGLIKRIERSGQETLWRPPKRPSFLRNLVQNQLPGGCVMFSRQVAEKIFPIPEHLRFEDWWISFKLLRHQEVVTIGSSVLIYKIHGDNDVGTERIDADFFFSDYSRHFDVLLLFKEDLRDRWEHLYWRRSWDIRKAAFGDASVRSLLFPPYNLTWFKLFVFFCFGAKGAALVANWMSILKSQILRLNTK